MGISHVKRFLEDRNEERGKRIAYTHPNKPRCSSRKSEVDDRLVRVCEAECLHRVLVRANISFSTDASRLARLAVFGKGSCVGDRVRVMQCNKLGDRGCDTADECR